MNEYDENDIDVEQIELSMDDINASFGGGNSIMMFIEPFQLKYFKKYQDVPEPKYATEGSACFDIAAYLNDIKIVRKNGANEEISNNFVSLEQGDIALIPTGLIFDIPAGFSVRLHPRSGLASSGITLANCEGIIDSDYVDEVMVALINHSKHPTVISHGQRIAQGELVGITKFPINEISTPPVRTTRNGGFGSTGK
jgi:dUTP pyrophosphatase